MFESEWTTAGVPFYRAREIVKLAKYGHVENELFIPEAMFDHYSTRYGIPAEGDIMVTGVGTLGVCYLVKAGDRFYFKDGNILWFKKRSEVISRFVEYAFKSDLLRKQIDDSPGATVGTYTIIKAKGTRIPVPPLREQQRIVSILDEAFAAIATAKANTEKNLANARAVFASASDSILAGCAEATLQRLEEVVASDCTLSYGIVQPGEEQESGLILVRPVDLGPKHICSTGLKRIDPTVAKGYTRTTLQGNELLLCVRGTTGTVGVATDELKGGNVTRGLVPVRFNPEIVRRDFGYYLLKSDSVQGQIRAKTYGAALMQINIRDVRDLLVRVPRLQEQDRAVKVLDDLEQDSHRLECLAQQKLAALDALKASLLHHAFTGQLTNSRQHRATANA